MDRIKDMFGLFTALIGLHYFYSFIFLGRLFNNLGLNFFPIITLEDITFPFGMVNYIIIVYSLVGFIWIYCWHLTIRNEDEAISVYTKVITKPFQFIVNIISKYIFKKKSKQNIEIILILFIFALLSPFAFIIIKHLLSKSIGKFIFLSIINFVIIPFLYIFVKSKRKIILMGYVGFIVLWGLFFINYSLENSSNSKANTYAIISFKYHEQVIKSSKNYHLVYPGYKYFVMRNDSTGFCDLFESKNISNIRYKGE